MTIDGQLAEAGWLVQSREEINRSAGLGGAVREFPTASGPVDYALFVGGTLCGVVEAKPEGTTLSGFSDQAARYMGGVPEHLVGREGQVRFEYVASGTEILFRDHTDPAPRSRRVFFFHRPETLRRWFADPTTIRQRLQSMPPLLTERLRECQIDAVTRLESSLAADHPRALIQMATGAGKTYTACVFSHRVLEHAKFRRFCSSPTAPIWSARQGTNSRIFARPAPAGLLPSSTMSKGLAPPVSIRTPRSSSRRSSASIRC
jgi:type I restriction enzyme R subunit